ncbi:MAG: hypothetical protein INQ03_21320 [Candidatus Heimdallarchaeota archaeon]|nr:hypothetical protein [Candidatus Heimdallarchaeota archaeon]
MSELYIPYTCSIDLLQLYTETGKSSQTPINTIDIGRGVLSLHRFSEIGRRMASSPHTDLVSDWIYTREFPSIVGYIAEALNGRLMFHVINLLESNAINFYVAIPGIYRCPDYRLMGQARTSTDDNYPVILNLEVKGRTKAKASVMMKDVIDSASHYSQSSAYERIYNYENFIGAILEVRIPDNLFSMDAGVIRVNGNLDANYKISIPPQIAGNHELRQWTMNGLFPDDSLIDHDYITERLSNIF